MKAFNKIKPASLIFIMCMVMFCVPQSVMGQRFGHGGGGGRGGGGGARGGGGAVRTINGGGRNIGAHDFGRGAFHPAPRPVGGGFRNENAFHHVYGGARPYFYHPYHPYIWGPYWHPFGFFAATLTADAILLSLNNQQYYYDNGVYYQPYNNGYNVVPPPIGATVSYLPAGYLTVPVGNDTYDYYGGAFYLYQGNSYQVVPAPVGAIVTEIPEGATDQVINGVDYLVYNNTYYEPISQNGQDAYEVVQVN